MIEVYDLNGIAGRTHKHIGIDEVVQDALDNEVRTISVISTGNYLKEIAEEIERRELNDKLRVVNLVNRRLGNNALELIIEDNLILRDSKEREEYTLKKIPDVGRVRDYTDFIPKALEKRAEGILSSNPDYIGSGVGTGKLLVTLYRKIKEKNLRTKLVGLVPQHENGIFNDDNLYEDTQDRLHFRTFETISLADKLSTPYTSFKKEIKQSIADGHIIIEANDEDFRRANQEALSRGYNAEISGSAGFVLYDPVIRQKYGIGENSRIIVINTGNGLRNFSSNLR